MGCIREGEDTHRPMEPGERMETDERWNVRWLVASEQRARRWEKVEGRGGVGPQFHRRLRVHFFCYDGRRVSLWNSNTQGGRTGIRYTLGPLICGVQGGGLPADLGGHKVSGLWHLDGTSSFLLSSST